MAETTRGENGKFVSKSAPKSDGINGIDTANDASGEGSDNILPTGKIDPAEIDSAAASGRETVGGKRKPGRPAGSGKKEERKIETPGKLDLDSLNFTLFYAHSLLAKVSNTPEIALDESEAKTLAASAMNVMQHYNIKASQKAIDWGNFVLTAGILYAGKFHAISVRKESEKKAKKESSNVAVSPFGLSA